MIGLLLRMANLVISVIFNKSIQRAIYFYWLEILKNIMTVLSINMKL